MKSIKACEYSRSRSFHDDLILQDQASGERSQDQWSSGLLGFFFSDFFIYPQDSLNDETRQKIVTGEYRKVFSRSIYSCAELCTDHSDKKE